MADAVLNPSGGLFPAGTSVSAYYPWQKMLGRAPSGDGPVATSTVADDGTLTFTGLALGTAYTAYGVVSGNPQYIDFETDPAPPPAGGGDVDLGPVEAEIAALSSRVNALETSGTTYPDASTTVKGSVKLSTSPVAPTNPIAVGDNDPRILEVADLDSRVDVLEAGDAATLAGLTDVNSAGWATGSELAYDASSGDWENRPRQVVYAADYGAVADGSTDCAPALRAACLAAPTGGTVVIGHGTYLFNSAAAGTVKCVLDWNALGAAKGISIVGQGKFSTVLKWATSNIACLITTSAVGGGGNPAVQYKGLELRDFTIDNNFQVSGSTSTYGVIFNAGGRLGIQDVRIDSVDTINVPFLTSGAERRNVNMTAQANPTSDVSNPGPIKNIYIGNCNFGRDSSGGGNYGVEIQGFSTPGTYTAGDIIRNGNRVNSVDIDEILIENCDFDSGHAGGPANVYSSTGFMVGGHGISGKVRIHNCTARNSADDGFELNSGYDVVVSDCTSYNCPNEGFYLAGIGGMPYPEQSKTTFINCTTQRDDATGSGVANFGFSVSQKSGSYGDVAFINCRSIGSIAEGYAGQALMIESSVRRLLIQNFTWQGYLDRVATANSQSGSTTPIWIDTQGRRCQVTIDGLHFDQLHDFDLAGFGSNSWNATLIGLDYNADLTLNARNVTFRNRVRYASGTLNSGFTTMRYRHFSFMGLGRGGDAGYADATLGTSHDLNTFIWDTGGGTNGAAGTDVTATATGIQYTSGLSAEKRFRGYQTYAGVNVMWGPYTDGCVWTGALVGGTVTDFKIGVSPKAVDDAEAGSYFSELEASNTYLDCYLTDDGTNSYLCLDKVVAGTRTSLLEASTNGGAGTVTDIATPTSYQAARGIRLSSRLGSGSTYYVRGKIRDNVVTADYFGTSAPSNGNVGGSPTNTVSVTLGSSDAALFGDRVQGRPMFEMVPIDNASRVARIVLVRMGVVDATIEGHQASMSSEYAAKNTSLFYTAQDSTRLRFRKLHVQYDVGGVDPSTLTEFENFDSTQTNAVRVLPGTLTAAGNRVEQMVHPTMRNGVVAGGNSGSAFTLDLGGSSLWDQENTLTANCTITLAGFPAGGQALLRLIQGSPGGRTVTFTPPAGGSVLTAGGGGASPTISGSSGALDVLQVITKNGLDFLVVPALAFA